MRRMLLRGRLYVPAIAVLLTGAGALAQQPTQAPPSVRVRIAMVPSMSASWTARATLSRI